ncbi:MAG: dihydroorotase [bacterium]|nr:dihydroorotase [bacterium]
MRILIKGGRVIDPARGIDRQGDILVDGDRIGEGGGADRIIEAGGLWVVPGLIDLHVHLREPGFEYKEDLASGTRAAARGGFTTVAAMANTSPVTDSRAAVEWMVRAAAERGVVNVLPVGAVSKGQKGEELAELGDMAEGGAVAFSDDGHPVANGELMRCALQYAAMWGRPVISHCEEPKLAGEGVMNLGYWSTVLGLRGMPAAAEAAMVARDIMLAELTGGHLHLAHLSTAASVALVRDAKARGLGVTAEVTPHHLVLTDEAVNEYRYDTDTKVNPPLRTAGDIEALVGALADGVIDAIATDHAPHHRDDKDVEYNYAAFGISGLETALGLVLTRLVKTGRLDVMGAIRALTAGPAGVLGLDRGTLAVGSPADVTVIDPERKWTVDPGTFASKGKNTPFKGWELQGRAVLTVVAGRIVHEELA